MDHRVAHVKPQPTETPSCKIGPGKMCYYNGHIWQKLAYGACFTRLTDGFLHTFDPSCTVRPITDGSIIIELGKEPCAT